MERAEKIGLGVAAAGHLVLFGALSLSLLWRDDSPKLGEPVEVTIAGDPGSSELLSDSTLPIAAPEPIDELLEDDLLEPEPEDFSPPDAPDVSDPPPDRTAELQRQREADQRRQRETDARKKREQEAKRKREREAKRKRDAEERRRKNAETMRQIANAANAANSGPPSKSAGQVRGEVNINLARQIKPFTRGCTPSGVDVKLIRTRVVFTIARNGKLTGITSARQSRINDNNRLQAEPLKNCILNAIKSASPYNGLDPDYFNVWKTHTMTFVG